MDSFFAATSVIAVVRRWRPSLIVMCPKCRSKIARPSGIALTTVECAVCGTQINVTAEFAPPATGDGAVIPSWTIIGGRVGRHQRFLDRLFKGMSNCFVVMMGAAIVVNGQIVGAIPWWRDVLFFTLGPAAVFAICYVIFTLISHIHARAIGLTCSACNRKLVGMKSMEAVLKGNCPYCLLELDITRYTT